MAPRSYKPTVYHEGFCLVQHYVRQDGSALLYCSERKTVTKCMASYEKSVNGTIREIIEHTGHNADPDRMEAHKVRKVMKEEAKTAYARPRKIISTGRAVIGANPRATALLGTTSSLSRMISRYKPSDSDSDAAREVPIRITQKFRETIGGKEFMIHDSHDNSPTLPRIIVFSSEEQQKLLAASSIVCSDGTFEAAKGIIGKNGQCWVLLVPMNNGEYVIVGWVLMENRQTVTYQRVIDVFKGLPSLAQWNVENISSDFEQGARRAWLNTFPNAKINYCFFHFEQSIRSYVTKQKVNLNDRTEFEIYTRVRNLPFLPEQDMIEAVDDMLTYSPNACNGLLKHMSDNYVIGSGTNGPLFKPEEWLLSKRPSNVPRTNNYCEASNSIMNSTVKTIRGICDGASLMKFFQDEEVRVSTGAAVAAINHNHRMSLPISKKIQSRNMAIENALSNPHQLRGFALLDHISSTLSPFQK